MIGTNLKIKSKSDDWNWDYVSTEFPSFELAVEPYVKKKSTHRPFLSSTPSTFLVNPSTPVSTLRPVIKPIEPKNRVVKVTTAVPENLHVTVTRLTNPFLLRSVKSF